MINLAYTGDAEFIQKLTEIVEANLGDNNFGVDELVRSTGVSPHIVRQRIKAISRKSISQFINEIRLRRAMEMLQQGDLSASQVAYKVGFSSPTYFNNCFHDFYGYPPGEVKKRSSDWVKADNPVPDAGNNITADGFKDRPFFSRRIRFASSVLIALALFATLTYFIASSESGKNSGHVEQISIAVLPFINLSDSPENRYFADGVMEDILSSLNRISSISVTSRTSVEKYRQTTKGVLEIARDLGVRYILEGSVQRDSSKVRIRVQLIDARRDRHILSETYDRELDDIFFIQSNIAIQVANKLEATLTPEETKLMKEVPTKSTEAYSLYLKGRYFWYKRTKDGFEKSIEYFTKAVEVDPGYALAWAGLGDGYFYISWYDWYDAGRNEGYNMAKRAALKALDLDNGLAEAHVLMGNIYFWHDWKWEEAENELSMAVKLNPNYYMTNWVYAELMDVLCKRDEARVHINRAIELEPALYLLYSTSSKLYYNEGNFSKAIDEAWKAIELNPEYFPPYSEIWRSYIYMDSFPQALHVMQILADAREVLYKTNMNYSDSANIYYNQKGMKGILQWRIRFNNLTTSLNLSQVLMMAGRNEEALNSLEGGYEMRERDMVRIISAYEFIDLRSEPRYLEIVRKMGLMEYFRKALASGQLPQ